MRHHGRGSAGAHIFIYRDRITERMLPEWPCKLKAILRIEHAGTPPRENPKANIDPP
jgi:hypothetical protein